MRNLFGYLAAVLSEDYSVELSSIVVEPNHYHATEKDNAAHLPDFKRDFHSFSARALNRLFDDEGSVWNCSQTSKVSLEEGSDILGKIAYVLTNPMKDGLVENGEEYPGLRKSWLDEPETFTRPTFWFDPKAKKKDGSPRWPDQATLVMHRPDGFDEMPDKDLFADLEKLCEAEEDSARAEHECYIGADVLKSRPRHDRPKRKKPHSRISPQVAAKNCIKRIARLLFNRSWRNQHEEARRAFIAGDRDVVFPHGTFQMRVVYGVNVAPAPT